MRTASSYLSTACISLSRHPVDGYQLRASPAYKYVDIFPERRNIFLCDLSFGKDIHIQGTVRLTVPAFPVICHLPDIFL